MKVSKRKPTHVGVFFKRRFIDENKKLNMTNTAKVLGISRQHLTNLCNGRSACTPEMAARLAVATDTNVSFWINMQRNYDTWEAEKMKDDLGVGSLSDVAA